MSAVVDKKQKPNRHTVEGRLTLNPGFSLFQFLLVLGILLTLFLRLAARGVALLVSPVSAGAQDGSPPWFLQPSDSQM